MSIFKSTGRAGAVLYVAFFALVGSAQAEPSRQMRALTSQLETIKGQADTLLGQVEAVTNFNDLPPLWAQAIALEESALPIIQQGIDLAQTVPNPSDVFKKYVIVFEHFHVKVVQTIIIIKVTILQFQEELGAPPGSPEPQIATIEALSNQLRTLLANGETLLAQIEAAPANQLATLWRQALDLEEQAIPITQSGIDAAQLVATPSFLLEKEIILFEHWHVKVIDVVLLCKVTILRLQQDFALPPPADQTAITTLQGIGAQLETLEGQANTLIAQVEAVVNAGQIPPLWAQALTLEEQVIPLAQSAIDTYQAVPLFGDGSPPNISIETPSELLKKEILIVEVWIRRVVMEICVAKVLIIRLEEELAVPQGSPEPQIATIIAETNDLRADDALAETLIADVRATKTSAELHGHFANGLALEEGGLVDVQAGIDAAQAPGNNVTELLKKKVVLLELWWVRVITEISIAKVIVIELHEIPAVSAWGLVVLTLCVLAAGAVVLRRRVRLAR